MTISSQISGHRADRSLSRDPIINRDRLAVAIIVTMLAVLAVRLHELIPKAALLRPALTASIGGLAILLYRAERGTLKRLLTEPAAFLMMLYFGWACFGIPFALWRGGALHELQRLYPAILLMLAILICPRSWDNFDRVMSGYVLAVAAFAAALVINGRTIEDDRMEISFTLDANDAAAMFAMVFPIALAMATRKGPILRRVTSFVAAGICLYGVVKTGSRGGTLAVLVAGLVFVLGQQGLRRIGLLFATVVIAGGAWTFGPAKFRERFTSFASGEQDYNFTDYGGRVAIWRRALRYWSQNPIVGVGIGGFPVAEGYSLMYKGHTRGTKLSNTHNAYLQAAAELGTVGLGLYLAMLAAGVYRASKFWVVRGTKAARLRTHRPELLASILGFATSAVFLSHAYYYPLFGMLAIIALASQIRIAEAVELVSYPGSSAPPIRPAPRPTIRRGAFGLRVPDQTPAGPAIGIAASLRPAGPGGQSAT